MTTRVIARFRGPDGEIRVLEDLSTGARTYCEGGVFQSRVRAGGTADIGYLSLMADLLLGGGDVLLLGCGAGALASMLHPKARSVTVVDVNPLSFQLARTFFWMPPGVTCVVGDMREFVRTDTRKYDAVGIDVGGPIFSYEEVLRPATIRQVRHALRRGGRISVNISCDYPDDPVPGRIAASFARQGLEVWQFKENAADEVNVVLLVSARREQPADLARFAGDEWLLARLG